MPHSNKKLPAVVVLEMVKKDGPLPYFPHLDDNRTVGRSSYKLVGLVYCS